MSDRTIRSDSLEVRVTRLENGLTVATEAMPHVATVALGLWVGAGSRHEQPDEHGLSHLIEHMAFKGTRRRSARQIAEDIENVGGDINAATSVEYTCYTARVLGRDLGVGLDVLGDILTQSIFDEAELQRERSVVLQEIASVEDAPDDLVNDLFLEAAFAEQAIGRPILGRPETIRRFGAASLKAFIAREYRPARMVLAAAGAVDHDATVDAAHRFFGDLRGPSPPVPEPARYRGGERRLSRPLEQANVVIGLPGCSFKDPDHFATQLFAHVLGGSLSSRLWQEVRERRGLAYAIDAFHWPFSDCGLFGVGAATAARDLPDLVAVTLDCCHAAAEGADERELARAKAQLKVSLLAALETPAGRIERIGRQLLAWDRIIPADEIVARVDGVSLSALRAAGRAVLAGPATLAAVGPIARLPSAQAINARLGR